jgi:hypothetical protein
MDDKIKELGLSRESFPEDQAEPFLKALGEEIADGSERTSFSRASEALVRARRK